MSSQDRAQSPIKQSIPIASCNDLEQAQNALIALDDAVAQPDEATSFEERREPQRSLNSDMEQISPVTATQTSIDIARPLHRNNDRFGVEETTDIVEPGETHTFLHKDHADSSPTQQKTPSTKGKRVLSLATWWTEVVALTLAIGALIAIVVTMTEYHDKQQPEWKYKINLNTLIAILSTLMRACLVVVAEEVISQLKWMLFRQPRSLQNLAHFDTASRGPWGSLLLVFRIRTLSAALLGCIVIVSSVGIGPFTQQAAESVPCDRPLESAEATIRVSRWIRSSNLVRLDSAHWDLDIITKVALLNGLSNPNGTQSGINPGCSTGNCLFPSYNGVTHSSVGMCKKCADITPWLTEAVTTRNDYFQSAGDSGSTTGYTADIFLPDGHGIGEGVVDGLPKKIMDVSGNANVWKSNLRSNDSLFDGLNGSFGSILRASILNVSVVTFTNNNCEQRVMELDRCSNHSFGTSFPFLDYLNVVATACSFYPCVRDYHGSVRDTEFTETVVREIPMTRGGEHPFPDVEHFHTPCLLDGQEYTVENISLVPSDRHNFTTSIMDQVNMTFPAECTYQIDGTYLMGFSDFMNTTLFGNCISPARINFKGRQDDYNTLICDQWYLKSLVNKGNASFQSIDQNMESIATAITSEMRTQGTGLNMSNMDSIPIYAKGTVIQTTVCMKFNWIWLSFPLFLVALTVLLLCISCGKMYFDTQMIPAWKSSLLPLLLTGNQVGATTGAEDMKTIKANTDNLVVSLAHLERGWEFVVEDYEDKKDI